MLVFSTIVQFGIVLGLLMGCKLVTVNTEEYFSRIETDTLRYISCITIIFAHMGYALKYSFIGVFHFLAVSVFFLLSGYGTTCSYLRGKESFSKQHVLKALELFMIWFIFNLIMKALNVSISGGTHFFLVISLLLVVDSLCVMIIRSEKLLFLVLFIFHVFIFPLICQFGIGWLNKRANWGAQSMCYGLGILLAVKKKEIVFFLCNSRRRFLTLFASGLLFVFGLVFYMKNNSEGVDISNVEFWGRIVIIPSFIIIIWCVLTFIQIGNKLTVTIGKSSMFIFLIHGIVIDLIKRTEIYSNTPLGMTTILFCSILGGICLNKMYRIIKQGMGHLILEIAEGKVK